MVIVQQEALQFVKKKKIDKVKSTRCINKQKYNQQKSHKIKKCDKELIKKQIAI